MTNELPAIESRTYQLQSTVKVLPDLLPLVIAEITLGPDDVSSYDSLGDYYLDLKYQVQLLEDAFGDNHALMAEESVVDEDGWTFDSTHPTVIQLFGEIFDGTPVSAGDDFMRYFFHFAAEAEFSRAPRQYGKYDLNDVVEAELSQYVVKAADDGAYFERVSSVVPAEVRVASTDTDPWEGVE